MSKPGYVPGTPWSDAEREQLRRMRENGLSMTEIGRMLGRSKNSVHRQMANMGLAKNERSTPVEKRDFQQTPNLDAQPQRPRTHPKGPVGHPRAPRSTLPTLPSLMMDD